MFEPALVRPHPAGAGGVQKMFRFENDYGASVIQSPFSYGNEEKPWELAVLVFTGDGLDNFSITYQTPITDDVLGYLSDSDVEDILKDIQALARDELPENGEGRSDGQRRTDLD